MTNLYVRSTDGSDADNGSTWALAKATLSGATAIDAAGDTIYISQAHSVTGLSAQTIGLAGTEAAPARVICGNDGAQPPTSVATASEATGASAAYSISGHGYIRGLSVSTGGGAGNGASINFGTGCVTLDTCALTLDSTSSLSRVAIGGGTSGTTSAHTFDAVDITLGANAAQGLQVAGTIFVWRGGSCSGPSSYTTNGLIQGAGAGRGFTARISGVDFSGVGAGTHLCSPNPSNMSSVVFRNCKLPVAWTGSLFASLPSAGSRCEIYNCDSGDTNYRLWTQDFAGTVQSETTVVRTGGASDGTTPLSWRMDAAVNASYPLITLFTPEIVVWNDTTDAAKTVTVEVLTDGVTLADDECWLEVQYLGTSGFPLGAFITDAKVDVLADPANQTTSSEAWTTTGLTTPIKQKLSVTFTPQEKGFVHAKVMLAKPSATVYVCPKASVT